MEIVTTVSDWFAQEKLLLISVVGLLLLIVKMIGIAVPIGYFFIFSIILWPISLVVIVLLGIVLVVLTAATHLWYTEKYGEKHVP